MKFIMLLFRYIVTIEMFLQNIKQACDIYKGIQKIILIGGSGKVLFSGREGSLDCKSHWIPKFYNHVFLFVGLKTLGTFIEFYLVVDSILIVSKFFINFNLQNGYVNQSIVQCLIP